MFEKNSIHAAGGGSRKSFAALATALTLAGVATFGGVTDAQAAPGDAVVGDLGVSIAFDGTPGFDQDDEPGHDSSPANGVVRSQDTVEYLVATSFAATGEVRYKATLPLGAEWDPTSVVASVCNSSGSGLTDSNRTLNCNLTANQVTGSFHVRAIATTAGNGAVLEPTFTAGDKSITAPAVRVSATPKAELRTYLDTGKMPYQLNGKDGIAQNLLVFVGSTDSAAGNFKGYESFNNGYSYTVSVAPHAQLAEGKILVGDGSITVTQPNGPGTDLIVSVSGQRTDMIKSRAVAGTPKEFKSFSQQQLWIWTPFDPTIPANTPTAVGGQLRNFAPVSTSGAPNLGGAPAPGQDPAFVCPALAGGAQLSCYGQTVNRTTVPQIFGSNGGAMNGQSSFLYGDTHGYTNGGEFVLPGQPFLALTGVRNAQSAGASDTGVWGVSAWDPKLLQLNGVPSTRLTPSGNSESFYYLWPGTEVAPSDHTIEYSDHSFASDAERKSFDPASITWVSDPSALPGGIASVSALRATYLKPLEINSTFGLVNPLARTISPESMALPAGTTLPWFWQLGSTSQERRASTSPGITGIRPDGGTVQTASALVRSTVDWSPISATPGGTSELLITPKLVGPAKGTTASTAKNVSLSVTMDSTCVEPLWDVVTNLPGYDSHTQADLGADGIGCTADDGKPATISFNFGDLSAPAGAAGPGRFQGHATSLDVLHIPVVTSPLTPSGTVNTATVIARSDSDLTREDVSSIEDRTEAAKLTVSGVASFGGGKTANTKKPGLVEPDEDFSYTVNWSNGTSDKVGRGTFVDVLPYNGDARGTTGMPASGFVVSDVVASTQNPAVMGNVAIEYSVENPDDIATALKLPNNSDGNSGIDWKTGDVPKNATAVRFITDQPIDSGYSGSGTISLSLPGLALNGMLKNDFYGKTAAVNGDENSIKRIVAAAEVSLAASAGSLAGTVQIDSDFSNSLTPSDPFWPASSKTLTLTSAEGSSATDVAADGAFFFETIAPGDYVASVSGGGWSLVLPATITVVKGEVHTDAKILFQESLKPLLLKPDTGSTSAGASTVVDVKKNDSWFTAAAPAPQTAASIQPGGEAAYGTATLTADGSLSYTSAAEWPAAFAGQPSYEDVVTYTVTDSAGATATTVVTITVYAAPVAVDDAVTIAASGSHNVDALGNDSGHKLELGDAPTTADDLHATSAQGKVSIASAHVWADGEATYDAVVTYSVVDAFGQPATANIAVTVQRAPVVTVEAGQTVPADGAAVFEPQLLNPAVVDPSDITVSTKPRQGAVSVAADGAITFTPGDAKPGEYTFTVTYTDDLGQSTTQDFTVTVYEVLAAADDTATLPWVRGSEIDVLSNDAGDDVTITTATSTGPDAGTVEIRDGKLFFTPSTEREWAVDELSYVETLEYGIIDAHGTAAAATVTLTIVKPPVGKDLHVDLASDVELVTFDPIGEATGTNIQRLSADAVIAKPANGKASIVDGVLTYAPNDGFAGDDTFTVRIEDALGQIGEVTYTVTVAAADIPETKLPETGGDNGGTGGGDAGTSGGNGGGVSTQAPHTVAGLAVTGTNESAWLLGLVLLAAGAVFGALASTSGSRRRLVKGSSHES